MIDGEHARLQRGPQQSDLGCRSGGKHTAKSERREPPVQPGERERNVFTPIRPERLCGLGLLQDGSLFESRKIGRTTFERKTVQIIQKMDQALNATSPRYNKRTYPHDIYETGC